MRKTTTSTPEALKPQIDKFRDLARELEADEDEDAFKAKLKKVATAVATAVPSPKTTLKD